MIERDLTLTVLDQKLNIRAAGIIIHNGKVLLHRNVNSDHYASIGGRVEIGEMIQQQHQKEKYKKKWEKKLKLLVMYQ